MKRLLTIGIASVMATATQAQFASNYLDFNVSGGVQTLLYSPFDQQVDRSAGLGGGLGLGYKHFFNDYVGIGTGLGVEFFNAAATCNNVETSVDNDGTLQTSFIGWEEKQKVSQFQIPLGIYFRKEIAYRLTMLVGAGAKIGFPMSAKYKVEEGSFEQTLIKNGQELTVINTSSSLPAEDLERDIDKKAPNFGMFLDLGLTKWFKSGAGLYFGLFANYGFSDVVNVKTQKMVSSEGRYCGVLESDQVTDVNLLSVGLKVGINLPLERKKKKADLPENNSLEAMAPMKEPSASHAPINHLPDSLIYIRYSIEEVKKVKRLIAEMPEVENVTEEKKAKWRGATEAYDTLTSFEKLDITWQERGRLKQADFGLYAEERLEETCQMMSTDQVAFPYMQSGFTSTKELEQLFDDLAFILRLLPDAEVIIKGHTDSQEADNDPSLGKERALFIREILMKKGIGGDQLKARGVDAREPICPMTSEEGRAKNRTATFEASIEE